MSCRVQPLETQEYKHNHLSTGGNHDAVEQVLLLKVDTTSLQAQRPNKKLKTDHKQVQDSAPQCPQTKVYTNSQSLNSSSSSDRLCPWRASFIQNAVISLPEHFSFRNPYPTEEETNILMKKTGLIGQEFNDWFMKMLNNQQNHSTPEQEQKKLNGEEKESLSGQSVSTGQKECQTFKVPIECCPLSKQAVAALIAWTASPEHLSHPYPTEEENIILMEKTGLNIEQLDSWFIIARRNLQNPISGLPTSAIAILKEWISSSEHFINLYPTKEERKMLIIKTGLDSTQLTNWLNSNARRLKSKAKLMEDHLFQLSMREYQQQQLPEGEREFVSVSGPVVSANPKNGQLFSLPAVIPPIQPAQTIQEHQLHHQRINHTAQSETPRNLGNEGLTRAVEQTLGHHNVDSIGKERFVPCPIPDQDQQLQPQQQVLNSSVAPGSDISSVSSSVAASTTTTTASNTSTVVYPPLQLKRRQSQVIQQQRQHSSTTATVIPDTISSQGCSTVLVVNQSSNVNTGINLGKFRPLSKQAAAALKAWISSPEHLSYTFPTEEKKVLKQLNDCLTHASNKHTKQNLVEKQQHQSSTPEQEQQQLREEEKESLSAQSFFFDQKNNQIIDLSKKDRSLSLQAVAILKSWITSPEHLSYPYPSEEEKKILIEKSGLTSQQMKNWFNRARKDIRNQIEPSALAKQSHPLPDSGVAILKEWISSPEHLSYPYPSEEEKKILIEKTGFNSQQLKSWLNRARRDIRNQIEPSALAKQSHPLPDSGVTILKEWISSPEHISYPYPSEEEKKILIEKTGFNSQQLKSWFNRARRDIRNQIEPDALHKQPLPLSIDAITILKEWISSPEHCTNLYPTRYEKKMLLEKTGFSSLQLKNWFDRARKKRAKACEGASLSPQHAGVSTAVNFFLTGPAVSANPKNCQTFSLPAFIPSTIQPAQTIQEHQLYH